ncbi:MAG: hypothetical protein PVH88_02115 [Ignavibacteria bacterium]|jgi:hypothetical protein
MENKLENNNDKINDVLDSEIDSPEKAEEFLNMVYENDLKDIEEEVKEDNSSEETGHGDEPDEKGKQPPSTPPDKDKTGDGDEKDTDADQPTDKEVGEEKSSKKEPPEIEPEKLTVTESFINQFEEDEKKNLSKYLGKPMTEIAKALHHSQTKLGKTKRTPIIPDTAPNITKLEDSDKELLTKMKIDSLKIAYPNMDWDDPEKLKEQLNDINENDFTEAQEIIAKKKEIETQVTNEFNTLMYVKNNHKQILNDSAKSAFTGFTEKLSRLPVIGKNVDQFIEQSGLNFTKLDENNKNELFSFLVSDGNGNIDPQVVTSLQVGNESLKVIIPEALENKALISFLPYIAYRIFDQGYKTGYSERSNNKEVNSLLKDKGGTKTKTSLTLEDIDKADPDELTKIIETEFSM